MCGRFDARRRSTLICCRRIRISASSFALDLKSEATTPRISLNRSFIRSRTYAVCSLRPCRIEYSVHTGDQAVVADQPAGKTREDRRQGRAPWPLRHLPDGRGRGAEGIVPRDSAADRGTTTTATTSACVRRRWSCVQERQMGGVCPNASENGQISPPTTVRAARVDGSRPNLASVLQEGRKTANIQHSSG